MNGELEAPATAARLRALEGAVPAELLRRAQARLQGPPGPAAWRRALSAGLALLGAALCGAAVVYAVAFNWQAMGREVRLGLPLAGLTAASLLGRRLGLDRVGGAVLLSVAALLAGVALLVYGQTYQTGADAWQLFATWALLVTPWTAAARFAPLALAWVLLVNTAYWLFWDAAHLLLREENEVVGALCAALGNGLLLLLWERIGDARLLLAGGRYGPRVVAMLALGPATFAVVFLIGELEGRYGLLLLSLGVLAGLILPMHRVYRRLRPDLFQLTLVGAAVAACVGTAGGRLLAEIVHSWDGTVLLLSLWILGVVAALGTWLRARHRELR